MEQRWLNSRTAEQRKGDVGTVEQRWWNTRTSDSGKVEHLMVEQWKTQWNSATEMMVEQFNI